MRTKVLFLLAFLIATVSFGAQKRTIQQAAAKNELRTVQATTKDGRTILVITNLDARGRRIGNKPIVSTPTTTIPETTITRPQSAGNTTPVSRRSRVRNGNTVVPATRPRAGEGANTRSPGEGTDGIPVCVWKGQFVSPVRAGNKLVCPSDRDPLPIR